MQNVSNAERGTTNLPFFFSYCQLCQVYVLRETGCCPTLRKGLCPQANKIFFGARVPCPLVTIELHVHGKEKECQAKISGRTMP